MQSRAAIEKDVFEKCFEYKINDKAKAQDMHFTAPAIPAQKTESLIKQKDKRSIKNEAESISRRHTQELFYTLHPMEDRRITTSRYIIKNREHFPDDILVLVSIAIKF